jgi:hypothetical protein
MTLFILAALFMCSRVPMDGPGETSQDFATLPTYQQIVSLATFPSNHVCDRGARDLPQVVAKYGDVMHLRVLGKPSVMLSSEQAASDLLDMREAEFMATCLHSLQR